jgi:hypothetical protein
MGENMSKYKNVFDDNIKRVEALKTMYSRVGSVSTTKYKGTDILRAAVVFLHSAFEEYYRGVVTEWLPIRGEVSILKNIALPEDAGKNKVNYTLYDLVQRHNEETIQTLFEEAVCEHMSRSSFNSYSEICGWGARIKLDYTGYDKGVVIEKAVNRRHKIVHEADLKMDDSGRKALTSIKESELDSWITAYIELVENIENQIDSWKKNR